MIWKSAAKGRLNNELLYYFFWAKKLEIMHMISYREDSTYYIYSHLCPDYGHLHIFWTLHDQHGLIHASLIVRVKASIVDFESRNTFRHFARHQCCWCQASDRSEQVFYSRRNLVNNYNFVSIPQLYSLPCSCSTPLHHFQHLNFSIEIIRIFQISFILELRLEIGVYIWW